MLQNYYKLIVKLFLMTLMVFGLAACSLYIR